MKTTNSSNDKSTCTYSRVRARMNQFVNISTNYSLRFWSAHLSTRQGGFCNKKSIRCQEIVRINIGVSHGQHLMARNVHSKFEINIVQISGSVWYCGRPAMQRDQHRPPTTSLTLWIGYCTFSEVECHAINYYWASLLSNKRITNKHYHYKWHKYNPLSLHIFQICGPSANFGQKFQSFIAFRFVSLFAWLQPENANNRLKLPLHANELKLGIVREWESYVDKLNIKY